MNRRTFIATLGGAAAWPLVARAQLRPAKIARIGIIDDAVIWDHFRRGLRELGYTEGRDITFEFVLPEANRTASWLLRASSSIFRWI
jgi:putative ABC transport system substrate-binding protein